MIIRTTMKQASTIRKSRSEYCAIGFPKNSQMISNTRKGYGNA